MGALWGFGHATGQACLGLAFVLLKERFNSFAPALARWSGTIVGLTLLLIGAVGIYESHFAKEEEPELALAAAADGGPAGLGARSSSPLTKAKTGFATYATGILYGLQPDALFVIIPALALPTKLAAVMYCLFFVLGTVGAMGGYTLVIGTTTQALVERRPWLQAHLSTVASVIAIAVGVAVLLGGAGFDVPFM